MSDGIVMGEGDVRVQVVNTVDIAASVAATFENMKKEIRRLQERDRVLSALEGAGVDNWEGYDDAMASLEES